mmetsp:Transcript_50207/g.58604  ORF Transcript_50207/g.58604 Transcript_50207/m.58604 type:complete len:323 (+) Transcript_50207:70-1038(+)|eukprot:CAMPEP_0194379432 /NCGR_PEP_ID=MMETSP0174-20130528/39851_1 /TAXON_ID=216777 /ORGANISM="Proboscia alata, Strain PI-D3" /LENGTH=322 /DNA_ID=CAMNT_0039162159 /DNA_START=48 /DNA_END=1016 /DNA_ORIENTATION=+
MFNLRCSACGLAALMVINKSNSFQLSTGNRASYHHQIDQISNNGRRSSLYSVTPELSTDVDAITTSQNKQATSASTISENPRLSGLSFTLDDGTRKSHSLAENTAFVTGFFGGLSSPQSFKKLVTSLYYIYTAMEGSFDSTEYLNVKAIDDEELRRVSSLEKDMEYFHGPNWKSDKSISPTPATMAYVSRINEIAAHSPHLLLAHQYTRYLGDLFGGQMMGGMATRSLDLKDGKGVAFYEFESIPNAKEYITGWYQRLNDLDLTDRQKSEILDEANYVFSLNIAVFEELEGSPLKAMWKLALSTFRQNMKVWHNSIGEKHLG